MAFNNAELPRILSQSPDALRSEEQRWLALDRQITNQEHPKYPEYVKIREKSKSLMNRMLMSTRMVSGGPVIEMDREKLSDLYEQAVQIRGEMSYSNMKGSLGVPKEGSISDSFEKLLEPFREQKMLSPILNDLQKIAGALDVNPAELSTAKGNLFYLRHQTGFAINFGNITWAKDTIKKIRLNPLAKMQPNLLPILDKLENAIRRVEFTDPIGAIGSRSKHNEWFRKIEEGRKMNWKPLQMVTGVGSAVILGVGLGYVAFGGADPGWPLAFWAGTLALSANPNLLSSRTDNTLLRIAAMNVTKPQTHDMIARSFHGEQGVKALEELYELRGTRGGVFKALSKESRMSDSQIGELTGSKKSALTDALVRLPEDKRAAALVTFGNTTRGDERELTKEYVRVHDMLPARLA